MKKTRKEPQETKNIPQVGYNLTIDERIEIFANLIIERILEDRRRGINRVKKP